MSERRRRERVMYGQHPNNCGGPGLCCRCDEIVGDTTVHAVTTHAESLVFVCPDVGVVPAFTNRPECVNCPWCADRIDTDATTTWTGLRAAEPEGAAA